MGYEIEQKKFLLSEKGENGERVLYWAIQVSRPGLVRTKNLKEIGAETHYDGGFVNKYFVQNEREEWERVGTFFSLEGGSLPHLVVGKDCVQFFNEGDFATRGIIFDKIFEHYVWA